MNYTDMSIKRKLGMSFGIIIALTLAGGLFSIYEARNLASSSDKLYNHPYTVGTNLRDIEREVLFINHKLIEISTAKNSGMIEANKVAIDAAETKINEAYTILDERYLGDKSEIQSLRALLSEWVPLRGKIINQAHFQVKNDPISLFKLKSSPLTDNLLVKADEIINATRNPQIALKERTKANDTAHSIKENILLIIAELEYALISSSVDSINKYNQKIDSIEQATIQAFDDLANNFQTENNTLSESKALLTSWNPIRNQLISGAKTLINSKSVNTIINESNPHLEKLNQTIAGIKKFTNNKAAEFNSSISAAATRSQTFLLIVILLIVAFSVFISAKISSDFIKSFAFISTGLDKIANSNKSFASFVRENIAQNNWDVKAEVNLDQRFLNDLESYTKRQDEVGDICKSCQKIIFSSRETADSTNTCIDSVNKALSNITATVYQIKEAATHITTASQTVSQGATEQASSLEEISTNMNEINSVMKQNAQNAKIANDYTYKVSNAAIDGEKKMDELITSMENINVASEKISKIIKVIDNIAFQTNLLALNAAVEAARAGQHGKGFAVVAEEVRNLSARSAKASSETAQLIEETVNQIKTGSQITEQTAESLKQIKEKIESSTSLMSEINNTSQKQALGIEQTNLALGQISTITQSNTAVAEESASSSQEMLTKAELLKDTISRFKIRAITNNTSEDEVIPEDDIDYESNLYEEPQLELVEQPQPETEEQPYYQDEDVTILPEEDNKISEDYSEFNNAEPEIDLHSSSESITEEPTEIQQTESSVDKKEIDNDFWGKEPPSGKPPENTVAIHQSTKTPTSEASSKESTNKEKKDTPSLDLDSKEFGKY